MRTAVASTSVDAYRAFRDGPKLGQQQRQIVDFLMLNRLGCTRGEIAKRIGLRLSSVCGRCAELLERGVLRESSRRPCSVTGISAHVLTLAPAQRDLFQS